MSLLEPGRLIRDEGFAGALRFVWNLLRDSEARQRVLQVRLPTRAEATRGRCYYWNQTLIKQD